MNQLVASIIPWMDREFGIHVQDHQIERITHDLEVLKKQISLDDNQILLKISDNDPALIDELVNIFTVQESYFFRDQSVFNYLKDVHLPQLIKRKLSQSDKSISVWSAGCCRGEELYTVAILLRELLPDYEAWDVKLLGTDIDKKAIGEAQAGIFRKTSMRMIDAAIIKNCFSQENNLFIINANIRKNVTFSYQNLASDEYPQSSFDIIFCRNVMIYFSNEVIEKALAKFYSCLSDDGILILGPSDFISYVQHDYKENTEFGITFYEKSVSSLLDFKEKEEYIEEDITYCESQSDRSAALQRIKKHVQSDHHELALKAIDGYLDAHGPSSLLYQYKSQCLLFMGDIETADQYCDKVLNLEKTNHVACFYKGLILMDKHDNELAKCYLQNCISHNNLCIEAYYYLAHIYVREKEFDLAKKILLDAMEVATDIEPDHTTLTVEHLTSQKMIEAIETELEHLTKGVSNE